MDRSKLKLIMLDILRNHVGEDNPISMIDLYAEATKATVWPFGKHEQTRITRRIIKELRIDGHPICHRSSSPSGYFWARNNVELNKYLTYVFKRALSPLHIYRSMKKISVSDVMHQLELDLTQTRETND